MQEAHHICYCVFPEYIHTPHKGHVYFRPPPPTPLEFLLYAVGCACHSPSPRLEFPLYIVGGACHTPPPPTPWNFRKFSTWLGALWKVYLCQKYCCTLLLYAKDNFSAAIRCLIISRTFLANN